MVISFTDSKYYKICFLIVTRIENLYSTKELLLSAIILNNNRLTIKQNGIKC